MKAATEDGLLTPDEMAEVRRVFFDQAGTALHTLAEGVLALEGRVPSDSTLRPLRRTAHTLKSDCSSVGLPSLSGLCHSLEDALTAIERGAMPVSSVQGDVLLAAVDQLKAGVDAAATNRTLPDPARVATRLEDMAASIHASRDDWERRLGAAELERVRDAVARGRHAVIVTATAPMPARRKLLRDACDRLGVEVIARSPEAARAGRPGRTRCLALSPLPAVALRAAAEAAAVPLNVQPCAFGGETVDGPRPDSRSDGEMVRVEAHRVDEALNLVGELVTLRSIVAGIISEAEGYLPETLAARLADAQSRLARTLRELQRGVMHMRMAPAERVFRRFSRVVRDLARSSGKRLALRISGETTELDRGILDGLEEPLLHLVRNAADHGIETPDERRAVGKPEQGEIVLRAGREGNQVVVEVIDDGRGIDVAAVTAAAVAAGLVSPAEAEALGADEALGLVFRPGLTTARRVTETSGRGVGLDVVREAVEALRGTIRASNSEGGGARFLIRLPLTLAIIKALVFRVGRQDLAVPLSAVQEVARSGDMAAEAAGDREVFALRGEVLGLARLAPLLGLGEVSRSGGFVLVLQAGAGRFGLRVDELIGEQELVIKALHGRFVRTPLVAGAALLGGGSLGLILDVPAVHRAAFGREAADA